MDYQSTAAAAAASLAAAAGAVLLLRRKQKEPAGVQVPLIKKLPLPLPEDYRDLRKKLSSSATLAIPGDDHYETARLRNVWNYDALGVPSGIVSAQTAQDVSEAVKYAAKHKLEVCVASGRHSHLCVVDDSLLIDLSLMDDIIVDVDSQIVTVQPGARLGQVDGACAPHGLGITFGHEKTTGCGGLVLHGGHGTLERMYGLSVDHLISAEVVLANGDIVPCNDTEESDLFWAIRGGGGNFGVVTEFKFKANKLPNGGQFLAGNRVFLPFLPFMPKREEIWKHYFKVFNEAPRQFHSLAVNVGKGPAIVIPMWVSDDVKQGQEFMDKHIRSFGFAVADDINTTKDYWMQLQKYASGPDGSGSLPAYDYVKGNLICGQIPEALAAVLTELADEAPPECVHVMQTTGGRVAEVAPDATAVGHRHATFWVLTIGKWKRDNAEDRQKVVDWVRKSHKQIGEVTQTADYGLLSSQRATSSVADRRDDEGPVPTKPLPQTSYSGAYGSNISRLRALKLRYDPDNLFHLNDNIHPATRSAKPSASG